ncbi:MAG: DUF6152 family protein [Terriglobia bacterium]
MKNLKWTALLAGAMTFGMVAPALAHHSHAMFDHTKQITVDGTVTEYVFRNPHVFLYVEAKGENGEMQNYWVEMSNLPNMIRRGIGQSTFKAGDKVKVNLHPLRDGRPGGSYITITTADGKSYE